MAAKDRGFYLSAVESAAEQPVITPGGSGYFSSPSATLDPKLFNGQRFRPDVRHWILTTLYDYWATKYHNPRAWSTVWVAGSGISYQWDSDRSNGDLDVLMGVDFAEFFAANPQYAGMPEEDMAAIFNADLHTELWPSTANWNGFEVTFYVNPGATDIRDINPYAAYNISNDTWTVHPPNLPADPSSLYSAEYRKAIGHEQSFARSLVQKHATLKDQVAAMNPGSPGWVNATHALGLVVDQAGALFDSIHLGRKQAFGPGGSGYGDYYNYRWQAHKQAGTVQALAALSQINKDTIAAQSAETYVSALTGATEALRTASLWESRG